jgi:hypothetical protein
VFDGSSGKLPFFMSWRLFARERGASELSMRLSVPNWAPHLFGSFTKRQCFLFTPGQSWDAAAEHGVERKWQETGTV